LIGHLPFFGWCPFLFYTHYAPFVKNACTQQLISLNKIVFLRFYSELEVVGTALHAGVHTMPNMSSDQIRVRRNWILDYKF
jgi:hypothetical protein